MSRFAYSVLLYLLAPLILLYLYVMRGNKQPAYRYHFAERLALRLTHLPKHALVFHCASVGEVLAAAPIIKKLLSSRDERLILTCNTPTGRTQIQQQFGNSVQVCYLPLDFWHISRRFIRVLQPKLVCLFETELWPNLIAAAQKNGCQTILLNARLSAKSAQGYQRFAALSQAMLSQLSAVGCHSSTDGKRFVELGLDESKLTVTGSVKFDLQISDEDQQTVAELKALWPERPVWVAGSTHPGEHEQVLAAHQQLLLIHPNALLIIAPRHPEQFPLVASLIQQAGLHFCSRTAMQLTAHTQVLLADTLGELKRLYGAANIAYVGGSLIDRGGHNPLEAAAFAVGILSGPSYHNFAHIYPELLALGGAKIVQDSTALATQLANLFNDAEACQQLGQHAQRCLAANQGAEARTLDLIYRHLE
ncbi:lipid IV(A) 3-deoxy-D-manno-octulosonic acid transferase [Pseudoalteromonas fenneropenaei]|uniref:3-deoxy-D-manno-octulosonic acid transferase n=1 Tax=Pseudoalteromonas fenneropenaei TaxID=1737459 RepID=A0ABV7CFU4_9GAMM